MPVQNPGFETAGDEPGQAAHWTILSFASLERFAGFGPKPHQAFEDFDRWTEFLDELGQSNIAIAFFDPLAEGFEDFEDAWQNDFYLYELPTGHVITAPFSGGAVEDMERNWANDTWLNNWDEVTSVIGFFDGEPAEDYEEQWKDNELYAWEWTDVTAARAWFDGGTDGFENFENNW
ncbi:MAG: hypothetical protein JXR76_14540 [Deltaproteobacteria bacterium]|nr:hypothetical protein [Deltaproteobacteria bacterium]